jgi:hypothetical protein
LLWLLVFLSATVAVVARQREALLTARRVGELRTDRAALEARRDDLRRRIRVASSRAVLVPKVERMGLRIPADSEQTVLRVVPPASDR